ncbi:hypothetical protein HDV03_002594 [Kappamyces sp. JEL0829]|nr:hypothetical protein HDV03_002594 [Kappamyces sp. JEL0829]
MARFVPKTRFSSLKLSHVDHTGTASMVDVGDKYATLRSATASAQVVLGPVAFAEIRENTNKKGDVLGVARIAGIQAAKQTSHLIPLCHQLNLSRVTLNFRLDDSSHLVDVEGSVKCQGQTGVEMEALTAVSVACLTIYDMCKAVNKGIVITNIRLETKSGGKSGDFSRHDRSS